MKKKVEQIVRELGATCSYSGNTGIMYITAPRENSMTIINQLADLKFNFKVKFSE